MLPPGESEATKVTKLLLFSSLLPWRYTTWHGGRGEAILLTTWVFVFHPTFNRVSLSEEKEKQNLKYIKYLPIAVLGQIIIFTCFSMQDSYPLPVFT